jgi:hypothetical protein
MIGQADERVPADGRQKSVNKPVRQAGEGFLCLSAGADGDPGKWTVKPRNTERPSMPSR